MNSKEIMRVRELINSKDKSLNTIGIQLLSEMSDCEEKEELFKICLQKHLKSEFLIIMKDYILKKNLND